MFDLLYVLFEFPPTNSGSQNLRIRQPLQSLRETGNICPHGCKIYRNYWTLSIGFCEFFQLYTIYTVLEIVENPFVEVFETPHFIFHTLIGFTRFYYVLLLVQCLEQFLQVNIMRYFYMH